MIPVDKYIKAPEEDTGSDPQFLGSRLSRRRFLRLSGLVAGLAMVTPSALRYQGMRAAGVGNGYTLVRDTLKGLVAFIVPGPDRYSAQQGVSTEEPGGIDAGITDLLAATLDELVPFDPPFSEITASMLNDFAARVNPDPPILDLEEDFPSHFARLSFEEKAEVFKIIESIPDLETLGAFLPFIVALLSYSEAGVFDADTHTLMGQPVGWEISGYEGVSDGRDEFIGYF